MASNGSKSLGHRLLERHNKEAEDRSCAFRCEAAQSFLKEFLRELLGYLSDGESGRGVHNLTLQFDLVS